MNATIDDATQENTRIAYESILAFQYAATTSNSDAWLAMYNIAMRSILKLAKPQHANL